MIAYPNIDPVAFYIPFIEWPVHWYGLMYLIGFFGGWMLLAYRVREPWRGFSREQLSDILFYTALGIILGGRIGYVLFYEWRYFLSSPWEIFAVWHGGMSFHGGLIGVIIAMGLYARKIGKSLVELTDFIAPVVPIGLGAGRIGNFINGELWGRVTDVSWAMVFPTADSMPRHPSQLYEFFLEGVVLFIILWTYSAKPRPRFAVSGLFLLFYGLFRFIAECFREPDAGIGYLALGLTKGQWFSLPMFLLGVGLLIWVDVRKKTCSNT